MHAYHNEDLALDGAGQATLYDNATADAHEFTTLIMNGSSTAGAYNYTYVIATQQSTVHAYDYVEIVYEPEATVILNDNAIRRHANPKALHNNNSN